MDQELTKLRASLACADREILEALKKRFACVKKMIQYKKNRGLPIFDEDQEQEKLNGIEAMLQNYPHKAEILKIFSEIMTASKAIQSQKAFDKNIMLIGFMGTGKSTVTKNLGQRLAAKTIEMDDYIVEKEGMSIPEIFEQRGETYFRNCESNLLIVLAQENHLIVSCGGGVPLRDENRALLKNSGTVVWLTATPEAVYNRVKSGRNRPILNGNMNVPFIRELMEKRLEKYEAAADIQIDTTDKAVDDICAELLKKVYDFNYIKF